MAYKQIPVYWREQLVGYLEDFEIDMWYQGGRWLPLDTEYTKEFHKMLEELIAVNAFGDIQANIDRSIWIGIDVNRPTHVVFSYTKERFDARLGEAPNQW